MCEIRAGGGCMRRGTMKYPGWGWNRKEGRGNKDFKRGCKLCQGVGALKSGAGTPLQTTNHLTIDPVFPEKKVIFYQNSLHVVIANKIAVI